MSQAKLSEEKKQQVIAALITEPTKKQACERLGINPRTLYNYLHDEDFMQDYRLAVNLVVEETLIELKTAMRNGAKILNDVILDEGETTENKLKAVKIAVEAGVKLAEREADMRESTLDAILKDFI